MRIFAILFSIFVSVSVFAADSTVVKYLEGRDFKMLETPVSSTLDPSKIEVTEVFSYICPHCYRFEPVLSAWKKKHKSDVVVVQMHTQWNETMVYYQRGFYTAVNLKIKDKVQMAIFDSYHKDGKLLGSPEAWADFLSAYGVNKKTVLSTYSSFIVTDLMTQANARTRALRISSTPELAVGGKYIISTPSGMDEASAHKKMLDIADFLIEKIRAERSAKH